MLSFASFILTYFLIGTAVFLSYIYWTSLSTRCLIIALTKLNGLVVPDRVWISCFNSFIYYRLFRRFIFSNLFFLFRESGGFQLFVLQWKSFILRKKNRQGAVMAFKTHIFTTERRSYVFPAFLSQNLYFWITCWDMLLQSKNWNLF